MLTGIKHGLCTSAVLRSRLAALLLVTVLPQRNTLAEILPTKGVFEGVYHQDSWGVGHFLFFIVPPDLHAKLAEHEGRSIRIEVTKGTQPMNPGPAVMLAVDKIEELPQPPLRIRVSTRPNKVVANRPFQLVVEVTNASEDESWLRIAHVISTLRQPIAYSGQRPAEPPFLLKEYSVGQLSVGETRTQMNSWTAFQGRPNLEGRGGRLLLPPRASYVWVTSFPTGIPASDGETKVEVSYALTKSGAPHGAWTSEGRFEKWQALPVHPASARLDAIRDHKVLSVSNVDLVAEGDGWTGFKLKLLPARGSTVRVPGTVSSVTGKVDPEKYANVGRLEAVAEDGSAVELEAVRLPQRDTQDGIAQLIEIPETGATVAGRLRKQSRFAPPITHLSLCILTDHGIETTVLSDTFKDLDVQPTTPFGEVTDGVKIRMRPAKAVFKATEPMTFHLQAVNVAGKPVCWWKPSNGLGENVTIEVDGEIIKLPERKAEYIGGWAAEWTCKTPQEWTIILPDTIGIARSEHTIRYIIAAEGGTYKNANNELVPIIRGRLVSNEARYSVE